MKQEQYPKIKEAYLEILAVCEKHKELSKQYEYSDIDKMIEEANRHLFGFKIYEEYGIDLPHGNIPRAAQYCRIDDARFIGFYGEKYNRTVSWEDNGKQPEDEFLLQLSFSTGAYIFGDDYPQELFKEFFNELKNYQPKYSDSHNNCLYFSMDNASKIYNDFPSILSKYYTKNKTQSKERKIKTLQAELDKLNQK